MTGRRKVIPLRSVFELSGSASSRRAIGWLLNRKYTVDLGGDLAYRRDRRGPRRALLRLSLEAASSGRPDRPVRTKPRRRHLGLRRGVFRTGAGVFARRRPRYSR